MKAIREFAAFHAPMRVPEGATEPMNLTPSYKSSAKRTASGWSRDPMELAVGQSARMFTSASDARLVVPPRRVVLAASCVGNER